MHSIRLSLTVYFLVLLAAALGGASWFVYRTAFETLQDKQKSTEALIKAQYEERCHEEKEHLDKSLLVRAQTLAHLVQSQFDPIPLRTMNGLGLLTVAFNPSGYVAAPLWLEGSQQSPFLGELYRQSVHNVGHFRLNQNSALLHADNRDSEYPQAEYFQIDSDSTSAGSYHSQALGSSRSLPLDPLTFAPNEVSYYQYDDIVLEPDIPIHRVILKTPMAVLKPPPLQTSFKPPHKPSFRSQGSRQPESWHHGNIPPWRMGLYVQCASDTRILNATLESFAETRDAELAQVAEATGNSLTSLRNRLLAVASVAFLVAVPGCFGLVRVGLAPLRRLSDAVSRVSAKDFHLPFGGPHPPQELRPIVVRLRETLELLKRAFAREKQATADISHELRTPLAALLTTTEMALRRPRSIEEYQEVLRDCQLSARQMCRAVERLLALARLDAGVDTLRLQAIDAAALAEQCMSVVRPLAEARGLRLVIHVDGEEVPQLTTDPDKFSEILMNLLHNAIQYNRPGGNIDVRLKREDNLFELAVRDTGVGIASEARAHLFERFWRADSSRGADGLHAGLGLAIVKGYVELMGGTIRVESAEGEGSTFFVQLPV